MVAGGRRIMKFVQKEEDEEEMGVASGNKELVLTGSYPIAKQFQHPLRLLVGYALTMKKKWSFLKPKFEDVASQKKNRAFFGNHTPPIAAAAKYSMTSSLGEIPEQLEAFTDVDHCSRLTPSIWSKGVLFVAIDLNVPLSEQGPFDVVLHKLSGKEWCQNLEVRGVGLPILYSMDINLEDYRLLHPDVTILDSPAAIQHLQNRQSMLQDVADLNLSISYGSVGVPRQVVIKEDASSSTIPGAVAKAGLSFPIVAKPLYSDGSAKSHELWLAYDQNSLEILEPPLVLQEFVNHGGILFKVFIIGEAVKVVRRFSLPDVSEHNLLEKAGAFRYPRVSCAAASADNADLPPSIAELPPWPLLEKLARELRQRLGLQLFNLDIIRERGTCNRYYVIDINYFPGYSKMPDYENVFADFLLTLVENRGTKHPVMSNC